MNMGSLKNLDHLLDNFIIKGPPGAALRVYKGKEAVYQRCVGLADIAGNQPFTDETICQMASMTKCIAVAAAMQLYERGEFLLTDPVSDYIPAFRDHKVYAMDGTGNITAKPAKNTLTVGHLFDMTNGITINWNINNPNSRDLSAGSDKLQAEGRYTLAEFAKIAGEAPAAFEAGEHFFYGQGLDVLAHVIEVISGQTFGEYLKQNIFDPLGMCDTHFFVPEEKRSRCATMYRLDEKGRTPTTLPPIFYTTTYESASGGLFGTIEDYSRFARAMTLGAFEGTPILDKRTIRLMTLNRLCPQALKEFENAYHSGYGYGLGVRTRINPAAGSNTSIGEFGWTGGFGTWVLMDPTAEVTIVYMHQSMPNREEYIHPRIRNIVYSALNLE
jgi:CubicO group peptidase (beta-lactamase class C family)